MLKHLEKHFDVSSLKEDFRKIGVNFITAGIVGVFINHFVGTRFSAMLLASFWITATGGAFLFAALFKREKP